MRSLDALIACTYLCRCTSVDGLHSNILRVCEIVGYIAKILFFGFAKRACGQEPAQVHRIEL